MVDYVPEPAPSTAKDHPTMTWVYRQLQRVAQNLRSLHDQIQWLALQFIIPNFTFAAHGTMFNTNSVIGPNIPDAGWERVTAFDTTGSVVRMGFDTTVNTWTYQNSGVYQVSVELVLSHNESNSGRQFRIRLNDGQSTNTGVPISVGRNQPGTNVALSFLQDIALGDPNRTFFLEVGDGGDDINNVVWEAVSVTIVNVGAWIDEVPTS